MQDINHVLVCFLNDKWITILDRKEKYTEDVFFVLLLYIALRRVL